MQQENRLAKMRKKKIIIGFFIFLALMWLCTIISKSIYASKLPVVTTAQTEQKYVEHRVEVEGIVIAGDKSPITALDGLRVDNLMVQVGDRVAEGDVLFSIDMEDLTQIMEEKQTQISKLQVQINTILSNEELAKQKKALEEQRAREDYDELARYKDTLVGRAAEEVRQAEDDIEETADERRLAQENAAAGSGEEKTEEELKQEEEQREAEDKQMKDALQAAAYAEADAKWERDNAVKEAGRKVEDILLPESEDSILSVYQLELADLQEELSQYQAVKDAEGQITARQGGLITDLYISVGDRIPTSAVMLIADEEVPCQFKTVLDQEQKKYVGLDDEVSLKLDGGSREMELSVDYLSESETMPGSYEIYINLPEGKGTPGVSGTMSHTETGEKYTCCISPQAIHKEDSRSYVYVVKEREGILGMEYYVEEVTVRILDENESWAAIEGALDGESQIIISTTKEVHNGDIVRY